MTRSIPSLDVLYEDNHLLVVNKPAGLATMGDGGRSTLHTLAGAYLKEKYHKPHGVYVGIVSRLDSMTSGVIVLARTSKAASRLSSQFANHAKQLNQSGGIASGFEGSALHAGSIRKTYLALVRIDPHCETDLSREGRLDDYLYKDEKAHRMRACESTKEDAKPAALLYQTLLRVADTQVLAVAPLTGRKHQIRVQFADRGNPIVGDRKYGSVASWQPGIALHSHRLTIEHPTRREPMTFEAPLPPSWNAVRCKELERRLRELNWT